MSVLGIQCLSGSSVLWTGAGSASWSDAASWNAGIPAGGETLVFTQGSPTAQPSNNDLIRLSVAGLSFVNNNFTAPLSLGGNAITLTSPATVTGATITRPASGTTATVTSTTHGLVTGQSITVGGGSTANLNATSAITVVDADTFTYTSGGTGEVTAGTGDYTLHALSNTNTAPNRSVTIENDIAVSGAQVWSTASDVDAVTILNGDLTGSGNITIGTAINSNGTNLPTLRLGGNNIGYTGTISFAQTHAGVQLISPASQTGGLVDLNANDRNLWLTSNSPANPYTFRTGNTTPISGDSMHVNFRNAGTSGIFLTGGDIYWNPVTSGNDYEWDLARAGTHAEIRVNGSNDLAVNNPPAPIPDSALARPRMLSFGNSSGSLVLGGNRAIHNGGGGSNAGRVTMDFALSDDGMARNFTTSASLMVLTRAAGGGPGTPVLTGDTIVSGGGHGADRHEPDFRRLAEPQ